MKDNNDKIKCEIFRKPYLHWGIMNGLRNVANTLFNALKT